MTSGEPHARRGGGWEAMHSALAADAVVAEALLYASGGRRLTVEHGQPLTDEAGALVQQLVNEVDQAAVDAGYLGGGTVTSRGASITWTFPSTDVPARRLVLATRLAADRLNPGSWVITPDEHPSETGRRKPEDPEAPGLRCCSLPDPRPRRRLPQRCSLHC